MYTYVDRYIHLYIDRYIDRYQDRERERERETERERERERRERERERVCGVGLSGWDFSGDTTLWGFSSQYENNYFTEMCSGSEKSPYLRLIDCVYHSILGLRVQTKKKKKTPAAL